MKIIVSTIILTRHRPTCIIIVGTMEIIDHEMKVRVIVDDLPPIITAAVLAKVLNISPASLAQDRYLGKGIPFVKIGKRVRYMRTDVLEYLAANRVEGVA